MTTLQKVAHVDDDPSIRAVAKVALEKLGKFTLLSCASGEEAIARIPEFAPDMILLDVMMPGMDGLETLRRLRQLANLDTTPVVFMTAKVQPREVEDYRALGACDVIVKPFDPMQLADQLRSQWTKIHE